MKTSYKKLIGAAAAAMFCAFMVVPANAQHSSSGGSGSSSSSSHSSGSSGGGGSAPAARPSGGGGGYSRPSVSGGSGAYRPSGSPAVGTRGSGAQRPTYVYRQGAIVRNTSPNVIGVRSTGNYGYPQRSVAGGSSGYRLAPRVASYWGTHGYYHFNHGYYTTYYLARMGYTCRVLPYGYYPFFWGDYQYFFCDGLFYTYANDEYTVVEPPVGAEVTSLPDNAQSIVINGQQYYECNGVYYQPVVKDDGTTVFVVAGKDGVLNTDQSAVDNTQPQGPQLGDIVTQLPPDCRKLKINGDKLWVSPDGIYYKEIVDASGNKTYKIVGLPDDQNATGQGTGQ